MIVVQRQSRSLTLNEASQYSHLNNAEVVHSFHCHGGHARWRGGRWRA
jgi:hypothetical protein